MGLCAFVNMEWNHVHLFAQERLALQLAPDRGKYKTATAICIYKLHYFYIVTNKLILLDNGLYLTILHTIYIFMYTVYMHTIFFL